MKRIIALFLTLLMAVGLFSGCSPDNSNMKKIGIMQFGEFDALINAKDGFIDGLKEAGYEDGKNITINLKSAAAETANCPSIADTLINDNSDLILAIATPSVSAIKEKTTTIPILFTAVTDPVESKLVDSIEKPGANITGTSDLNPIKDQIDLLTKLIPNAKKVAVLYCSSESNSHAQYTLAKEALENSSLECTAKTISEVSELKSAIESLKGQVDAIYVPTDNTIADAFTTASSVANENKIPLIVGEGGMVKDGGLATFGIDYYKLGKQTAAMAVKILKGEAAPADIPVEYLDTESHEISVNTDSAKTLGITIPEDILSKAVKYPKS